jgi:chitosanase
MSMNVNINVEFDKKRKRDTYKGVLTLLNNNSDDIVNNWYITFDILNGSSMTECKNFEISGNKLIPNEKIKILKSNKRRRCRFEGTGETPTNFKFNIEEPIPITPPTPIDPIQPPTDPADDSQFLRLNVADLDIIEMEKKHSTPWNIIKVGHGSSSKNPELHSIIDFQGEKVLKVNYPKGSFKPSSEPKGGIGFYACPKPIFPQSDFITLSYDLYFDDNFDPVKGGKLPGIFIGEPGASGGRHSNNQASARIMWRKADRNEIEGEIYMYISDNQDSSYKNIPGLIENSTFGDSLWRGILRFQRKKWNRVVITVKLNTFNGNKANKDGIIMVSTNNITQRFDKLVYTDQKVNIEGITTDTFFGGGDSSFATPFDTSIYFKNFIVIKTLNHAPIPSPAPQPTPVPTPIPVSSEEHPSDIILKLVSIAENSSTDWQSQINYIENINDGRGYTISIVGFCTGTWDFIQVLQEIQKINSNHPLVKFIPLVQKVDGTSSVKGLEGLPAAMKDVGINDPVFNEAMWRIIKKLYWGPALEYCKRHNLTSNLSKYIAYDTNLNFGQWDYNKKYNLDTIPNSDEATFLRTFLDYKQKTIEADRSLGDSKNNRVDMQKKLLDEKNFNLTTPMTVSCYGDTFTIN